MQLNHQKSERKPQTRLRSGRDNPQRGDPRRGNAGNSAKPTAATIVVFRARAEARALLWRVGEFSLHEAVDKLQADAVKNGLVDAIGQDELQRVLADAFHSAREASR